MKDETVWLNTEQMAKLFDRDYKTIRKHINNALEEELDNSTIAKICDSSKKEGDRNVTREIEHYNLDMIISVGYRVKSKNGIIFRKWANKILKDYMIKGYAVNQKEIRISRKKQLN
ncbi:MAG: virulence RhuM family protein [Clostridium sp.]|nr:MAG: virulence RhuM family protein [Clostridium sp.]